MNVLMAGMWLQDGGLISTDTRLLTIFVGLVALAMLIQAIVVLALGFAAMKAQKKLLAVVDDLKKKAMPVIASAENIVREATPKVKVVVENVVETSHMVRNKVHDIEITVEQANTMVRTKIGEFEATLAGANQKFKEATDTFGDVNTKTRGQISRVDGMITSALKATSDLGTTINQGIQAPVRQVAGIATGVKTGIDTLLKKFKVMSGR